jgi:hypothetical protein
MYTIEMDEKEHVHKQKCTHLCCQDKDARVILLTHQFMQCAFLNILEQIRHVSDSHRDFRSGVQQN